MEKKPKLSRSERLEIGILLSRQYGIREIARVLGRSPSSISEEIKRNSVNGIYDPLKADHKAYVQSLYRRLQWRKINHDDALQAYIIEGLKQHWNPDEIAGSMKEQGLPFYTSKTAIYEWLRTSRGDRYCEHLYSQRHYRKKHKPKTERVLIPNRVGIEARPLGATNRTRYGHWEGDTMVSGRRSGSTACLSVMCERKTRYVTATAISNLKPATHVRAVRRMTKNLLMKSSTWDNGVENQQHQQFGMSTFFCDPYSSWQKGGVENVNKMLRRYFPKGMDLSLVTKMSLQKAVSIINGKPRRSLGFRSAEEMARVHGIFKGNELTSGVRIEG